MLVINVFLLFVGLAMEMIASMVILVPLLVPILSPRTSISCISASSWWPICASAR